MNKLVDLSWTNHLPSLAASLRDLRSQYTDLTIVTEDNHRLETHRFILAASSTVLKDLLDPASSQPHRPILYMRGIKAVQLVPLLDFLYCGQAQVEERSLEQFLGLADELRIQGLTRDSPSDSGTREDLFPPSTSQAVHNVNSPFKIDQLQSKREESGRNSDGSGMFEGHVNEERGKTFVHDDFRLKLNRYSNPISKVKTEENYNEWNSVVKDIDRVVEDLDKSVDQQVENPFISPDMVSHHYPPVSEEPPKEFAIVYENGNPRFQCPQCPKTYKNKADAKTHFENHTDAFSYFCDKCDGKTFKSKNSLRMHNGRHLNY